MSEEVSISVSVDAGDLLAVSVDIQSRFRCLIERNGGPVGAGPWRATYDEALGDVERMKRRIEAEGFEPVKPS